MNPVLGIVTGLVILVVGAEVLVRGGSRLAARLGITPIVVGVTVVALGTSAPELAVGIESAATGNSGLALGAIVGTNIVNLLLILGLSALLRTLHLGTQTLRIDLPAITLAAVLLWVTAADGRITPAEGIGLIAFGLLYTVLVIRAGRTEAAAVRLEYADEFSPDPVPCDSARRSPRSRCCSAGSPSSCSARKSSSTARSPPRSRWACPTP